MMKFVSVVLFERNNIWLFFFSESRAVSDPKKLDVLFLGQDLTKLDKALQDFNKAKWIRLYGYMTARKDDILP